MRITKRLALARRRWRQWVPLIAAVQGYNRGDLGADAVAGFVVGMVTVPQAVAYAYLAGLPPQAGLYACLLPMLIYAFFGSSKHMVVGPVAVAALLVAAAIGQHAPNYNDEHLMISTLLCLQVGLILFALNLFKMGGLVNLLSHPVITGFVNAAAILILVSQLPAMTGIPVAQTSSPLFQVTQLLESPDLLNPVTAIIGLVSLLSLFACRPIIQRIIRLFDASSTDHPLAKTGPLWVAILGIAAVVILDLPEKTQTVGVVPGGLPSLAWPVMDLALWLALLPSAMVIAVITYIESYSIGATLAAKERYQIRPDQELMALGTANIGAAISGAYPVAGSFSRSGVNYAAGARTPISAVICALIIVATLLFFTDTFINLPKAALAAIVMVSVLNLIDFTNWRKNWRTYRQDCWTEWGTTAGVLVLGVEIGLLFGVLLSVAFFLRAASKPVITQIGRLGDSEQFRSAKRYPVTLHHHVLALRVDENIFFANATQIEERVVNRALRRRGTTDVLLACGSVNRIDSTGLTMLRRMNQTLADAGICFSLSEIKGPLMTELAHSDIAASISGSIYSSNDEAMQALAATESSIGAAD